MFDAAADGALGIPVVNDHYPEGEEGIQKSLAAICKKIREGMATAIMKSYAGNVLKQAGFPDGVRAQAAALLDHVRQAVMYAPDALGTEQIQTAAVSLCVEGAPVCIPIGDCDDLVVALGTLCAAVGMDVEVIRQFFGNGHQQHVLVQVMTETGAWFPLDPSSKQLQAGEKARAAKETTCSPWDSAITGIADSAQYIGIGALPVFTYRPTWRRLRPDLSLEDSMRGLGAIWQGASALQPQVDWLGQVWAIVDAKGRSWAQALSDARERAANGVWPAGDSTARADLMVIIVSTAIDANAISTFPEIGQQASNILTRTWIVMLRQLGIDPSQFKSSDLRTRLQKDGASQANIAVFDLLLIVAAAIGAAIIYAVIFYFIAQVVDNLLARIFLDRELVRIHVEEQKILEKHLADGTPLSQDEKDELDRLHQAQDNVIAKQAPNDITVPFEGDKKKDSGSDWWLILGVATVVVGGVVAVAYREEIKRALSSKAA